ncbi:TonB-dependent receptor [Bowmanella denitrificans]|uniref:TonB-dependent receptor n=1 Tax=Bowmanella denitrificans TaxID=366582 RepID=A0ABN0WLF5_9ALTE
MFRVRHIAFFISTVFSSAALAHGLDYEHIAVHGHQTRLLGQALSASEGVIGQGEIAQRPLLRTGEVLELVPGMVVTQHSGSGKANQYFLRGFNLDHGTDFQTSLEGMPLNMRTHGHGQAYTDLNFIVPEFIGNIQYRKGAYHADQGDFATAGSARFFLASALPSMLSLQLGQDNYQRAVVSHHLALDDATLSVGLEATGYDGPWTDIDEGIRKYNGLVRYNRATDSGQFNLTLMAYDNRWQSADQIPQRAVDQGLIDKLGSLDTTLGGESDRYSLSLNWQWYDWAISAYAIESNLDLFSNFTYYLNDPIQGDQFKQVDKRRIWGGEISRHAFTSLFGKEWTHEVGAQLRYDDIGEVALYNTKARQVLSPVRVDSVDELSSALYWQSELLLTNRLTLSTGVRYDYFDVSVNSDLAQNSGDASDDLLSFNASLSYSLTPSLEGYINAGQSFHSNDARGATIQLDPVTGDRAEPVDLLVRGDGMEIGLRYFDSKSLNLSVAIWTLELDSELLFVGDAGNTEASRGSRRYGVEAAAYYWLNNRLSLDMEVALSHSRFRGQEAGEGDRIDGSLPVVASAGFTWQANDNISSSLRIRHFGKRLLDSRGEVRSEPLTVMNLSLTYALQAWQFKLEVLNLLDSDDHDIDYLYESRLPGEPPEGVEDIHYHPIEPRTLRLGATYHF